MSFASISCCRGPTKADIESARRPGATAERIGTRGIRPRQELATASMSSRQQGVIRTTTYSVFITPCRQRRQGRHSPADVFLATR